MFSLTVQLLIPALLAQAPAAKPDTAELRRIEQRGQEIASYEEAAIRSTDLLIATEPDLSSLGGWVALRDGDRWIVLYGRFKNTADPKELPEGFVVKYGFSAPVGKMEAMTAMDLRTEAPKLPFKEILALANAGALAKTTKSPWDRPWNIDLFREADGTITGYLLPGNTDPELRLLGGDFRLTFSADGTKLLNSAPLHKSLIPQPIKGPKGETALMTYHTHVLTDYPTETDVAFALLNQGLQGHFVLGPKWVFKIDSKGRIEYLGTPEEFLGKKP